MSEESSNSTKIEDIFSSDTLKKFGSDKSSHSQNSQDSSGFVGLNDQETVIKTNVPNQDESDSPSTFSDGSENSFNGTDKETIISVPQGFYAKITPETPPNIIGLFTDGLGPCACIILTDKDHNYMFLAHADSAGMNICDPEMGIPAWIKEMKNQGIEEKDISLHCGIDSGIEGSGYPYEILIKDALLANGIENINFNVVDRAQLEFKAGSGIILRKGVEKLTHQIEVNNIEIENNNVHLDLSGDPVFGLGSFLRKEQQLKIQDLYDIKRWRLDPIEFDETDDNKITNGGALLILRYNIANNIGINYDEIGDLPFPPICCFDGINFKEVKGIKTEYSSTITQYENSLTKICRTCSSLKKEERWLEILTEFYSNKNKLTRQGKTNLKNALAPEQKQIQK